MAGSLPGPYLALARRRYGSQLAIGPATDVVVEGFPRSANTFAVVAFQQAQPRQVRVAHHLHAPAQVIAGVRRQLPVMVLLRAPDEAVASLLLREPYVTPGQAFRRFVRFYAPLRRFRDGFVVATFDQVTQDFGSVIHRLNARFGTDFMPFIHTEENVRLCFEAIEALPRRRVLEPGQSAVTASARPIGERAALKASIRTVFNRPELDRLRIRAAALYEQLAGEAPAMS